MTPALAAAGLLVGGGLTGLALSFVFYIITGNHRTTDRIISYSSLAFGLGIATFIVCGTIAYLQAIL